MKPLFLYLILINALGFSLMLIDKRRAIKKKWRIREATLFAVAILGGSIGSLMGMHIFRHKTRHKAFTIGMPTILASQIMLAITIHILLK